MYPAWSARLLCPPRLNSLNTFLVDELDSNSFLPHQNGTISSRVPCIDMNGIAGSRLAAAEHTPSHLSFINTLTGRNEKTFSAISTHDDSPPSATMPATPMFPSAPLSLSFRSAAAAQTPAAEPMDSRWSTSLLPVSSALVAAHWMPALPSKIIPASFTLPSLPPYPR